MSLIFSYSPMAGNSTPSQAIVGQPDTRAFAMGDAVSSGKLVGDNAAGMLRGLMGNPSDQEKLDLAKQEIAQLLQGKDLNDPSVVYPVMIQVYQKYGFVTEAMKLVKEYEEVRNKRRDDARAEKKDAVNAEFLKAKAAALMRGDFTTKMQAYGEILTKLQDPTLSASDREALLNMKRAAEAQLGIKDRDGLKVIPASKYSKGGVFRQDATGEWKFEAIDLRDVAGGAGSGSAGAKIARTIRVMKEDGEHLIGVDAHGNEVRDFGLTSNKDSEYTAKRIVGMELITELAEAFKDSFTGGGYKYLPESISKAWQELGSRGIVNSDEAELLWWKKYDEWYNRMLNALSGAAVTASEAERFKQTVVTRGMDPGLAKKLLAEQIQIAKMGLNKLAGSRNVAVPGSTTAPASPTKRPTQRFNPATGKLEAV
jgi:hypothetical protein